MNWLIKNLVCTFFITYILSNAFFVSAQMHNNLYGNEWIKPLQTYFKLKIVEDGVYRIDKSVLSSNGVNLQTTLPNQFRLYTMGQEIPIYVHAINNTTYSEGCQVVLGAGFSHQSLCWRGFESHSCHFVDVPIKSIVSFILNTGTWYLPPSSMLLTK